MDSRHWGSLLAAICGVALLLALLGGSARVGLLAPPDFVLDAGPVRLVAQTTIMSLCPQLAPCQIDQPIPLLRLYSVWLYTPAPRGNKQIVTKLLTMQIGSADY